MKQIPAILFSAVILTVLALQPAKAQDEKDPPVTLVKTEGSGFTFEKIFIDLPGVTKEQAYDRAKQWILNNFKTADNNMSFDDKGKDNINTSTTMMLDKRNWWTQPPYVSFKFSISFKENKIKINASQFLITLGGMAYTNINNTPFDNFDLGKKDKIFIYESFDQKFTATIAAIKDAVSKKSDW